MNKQSNMKQDKISEVEKGCGLQESVGSPVCKEDCLCDDCNLQLDVRKEAQEIMNERGTKTKFTKEQLKEIEKIFDIQASLLSSSYAQVFNSIARLDDSKDMLNKLLNEFTFAFDMHRTISAKADIMQNECEDKK